MTHVSILFPSICIGKLCYKETILEKYMLSDMDELLMNSLKIANLGLIL